MTKINREVLGASALAVGTVCAWWVWLGSDHTYRVDASGVTTGPYEPVQVIGMVLALIGLTATGALLLRPVLPPLVVTVAFTTAWTVPAATSDETGLWLVGAALVLAATAAGSALVTLVTTLISRRVSG